MSQFCNKKRKREEEEIENGQQIFTIPEQNKKLKKYIISFPQEVSELSEITSIDSKNFYFNNQDQNSISTFQSKYEQIPSNTNNSFLFKVKKFNENQKEIHLKNLKKIESEFDEIQEDKIPEKKINSVTININIKKNLLSNRSSFNSKNNSNYNSSSHYSMSSSNHDEYYPYEVGEIIENEYLVS